MVLLCNSPGEIPAVIDALTAYVSPTAQLHLIRLRGGRGEPWESLRASQAWRQSRRHLDRLSARPELELEG